MIKKALASFIFPLYLSAQTLQFAAIDFPPYIYFENNQAKGFNVEILNTIFERMDINIEYKSMPWARAIVMLKSGKIDALFPLLKTRQRETFIDYTDAFTSEPFGMFVLKSSVIEYDGSLNTLNSYTFGRVRGYSSGQKFDAAIKEQSLQIDESTDSYQNISKFLKKRFDILVDNQYYILHTFKQMNKIDEIRMLQPLLSNTKAYLGFSKKRQRTDVIKKFNSILDEIKKDGTYDAIIKKYFH